MSAAGVTDGLLGIGSVLALLRPDFPDVTISKIRFLETEGLVEPERTSSGYRKFSPADLDRLRYVLACQRDHYLPLKVIREHLEAIDRGLEPVAGSGGRVPRPLASVDSLPSSDSFRAKAADVRLSRRELVAEAGITEAVLDQLESFAIVAPLPY
ncbi:MAG: MerR family transcriptional regulator, partial [Candidatus Nanopelagicales bacterium]